MRIIIILLTLAFAGQCSNLIEVSQSIQARPNDVDGVILCIAKKPQKITDIYTFCGAPFAENAACYKDYSAVQLCLLNNNCQFNANDLEIKTDCWNCWADIPMSSKKFTNFQKVIVGCYESFISMALLLLCGFFLA